ncbi:DUF397 domain-containing protein [Streptomyces sp. AS58]|nr:DUF397 domain-containing protein [Streptomyces sp. AS58]
MGVAGAWGGSAVAAGTVAVIDSKDQHGPILEFDRRDWAQFVAWAAHMD